jgi:hypothetical protein
VDGRETLGRLADLDGERLKDDRDDDRDGEERLMDGDRLAEAREPPPPRPPPPRETPRAVNSATGQRHVSDRHSSRMIARLVLFISPPRTYWNRSIIVMRVKCHRVSFVYLSCCLVRLSIQLLKTPGPSTTIAGRETAGSTADARSRLRQNSPRAFASRELRAFT